MKQPGTKEQSFLKKKKNASYGSHKAFLIPDTSLTSHHDDWHAALARLIMLSAAPHTCLPNDSHIKKKHDWLSFILSPELTEVACVSSQGKLPYHMDVNYRLI